jgi:hypothetical protein
MNQNPLPETQPNISPEQSESQLSTPNSTNSSKNILIIILGIITITGAIYSGYYFGKKEVRDNQPIAVQETNTPIAVIKESEPTTITEVDPTKDWNSYTNTEYNYTIKYPSTFKTQIGSAGAGTTEAPPNARNLFIYNPEEEISYINRYVDIEIIQLEPTYNNEWIRTTIPLAGKNVTKLVNSSQTSNFDIYLVPINNNQGMIQIYVSNDTNKELLSKQILSTFEFVDPTTTDSGMEVSSDISFPHKYLPGFYISIPPSWDVTMKQFKEPSIPLFSSVYFPSCHERCMGVHIMKDDIGLELAFDVAFDSNGSECFATSQFTDIGNKWYRIKKDGTFVYVLNPDTKSETNEMCTHSSGEFLEKRSHVEDIDGSGVPILMENPRVLGNPQPAQLLELDQIVKSILK